MTTLERVARDIQPIIYPMQPDTKTFQQEALKIAQAAIDVIVPEGFVVVPRELPFEMHEYADTFELHDHCIQTKVLLATTLWKAVISHLDKTRAAPEVGDA